MASEAGGCAPPNRGERGRAVRGVDGPGGGGGAGCQRKPIGTRAWARGPMVARAELARGLISPARGTRGGSAASDRAGPGPGRAWGCDAEGGERAPLAPDRAARAASGEPAGAAAASERGPHRRRRPHLPRQGCGRAGGRAAPGLEAQASRRGLLRAAVALLSGPARRLGR